MGVSKTWIGTSGWPGPWDTLPSLICKMGRPQRYTGSHWPTGGAQRMGQSPFRGEVSPRLCKSYIPQTISVAHRQGQEDGGGCSWRRNLGAAEAASRQPGGWTPAPREAAERSARNLLTGPEQRAANPAGGRGRASGRRDPAPSPRRRRVHRAFLSWAAQGRRRGGAGQDAQTPTPTPWAPLPRTQLVWWPGADANCQSPRLGLPLARAPPPRHCSRVPQPSWPKACLYIAQDPAR